jgi:hypothetical protein
MHNRLLKRYFSGTELIMTMDSKINAALEGIEGKCSKVVNNPQRLGIMTIDFYRTHKTTKILFRTENLPMLKSVKKS